MVGQITAQDFYCACSAVFTKAAQQYVTAGTFWKLL